MGGAKPVVPLTDEQRQYATEHHDIIYKYLRKKGLPVDEWYDVVVFGYLQAVRKHDFALGFSFVTFAYKCMNSIYVSELRERNRMKRKSKTISFDACEDDCDNLYNVIGGTVSAADIAVSNITAQEIFSHMDERHQKTILCSMLGFTFSEQAKILKVPRSAAYRQMCETRQQVIAGGFLDGKTQDTL